MSFGCEIRGKGGEDLLEKYDINHQLIGIANGDAKAPEGEPRVPYSLSDIRTVFSINSGLDGSNIGKINSQAIIASVHFMIRQNIESLGVERHCETCYCPCELPKHGILKRLTSFLEFRLMRFIRHREGGEMEKKIINYDVISVYASDGMIVANQLRALSCEVEKAIKTGWQPHGFPMIIRDYIVQAVVKYED